MNSETVAKQRAVDEALRAFNRAPSESGVYPDSRAMPQRMREAADTIDELLEMAGPWQHMGATTEAVAQRLREHADSLEELLNRVLGRGSVDV